MVGANQYANLERKKFLSDPILVLTVIALVVFLTLFVAYPLVILLRDSVYTQETGLTLANFISIFGSGIFRSALGNTLTLGFLSGILSTAVGFLFAYVDCYVKVRLKRLFKVVSVLPVVSPPFVLSLSFILLFGRRGIITRELFGWANANIYGLKGVLAVQVLTFFPVCYLMIKGLLKNIDPSLEESAYNMGAGRFRIFRTVTLPLMLPGLGNAFLVTFIESIADFTNPMVLGGDFTTLATEVYTKATGSSTAAIAVVILLLTMLLFLLEKYWLERKTFTTLTGKASRERVLITEKSVTIPLTAICAGLTLFVMTLYILIPFGALFKTWGKDYTLVLDHFAYVINLGIAPFRDSLVLSAIAAPITAVMAMAVAYLLVKKRFFGKRFIEFVSLFAMAVPGTVLGLGYIRGFNKGILGSGVMAITNTAFILIVAFVVRSLPVGTRSGVAALQQIDRSIEESATDLGAGSGKVFTSMTLPLIKDAFFSGLVTSFVRSMTATSAVILLVSPTIKLITPAIMNQVEGLRYGVACAYATILIVIVYGAILLMNLFLKFFGVSRSISEVQ